MIIVVLVIIFLMLLGLFGFIFLPMILATDAWAKRKAKAILGAGRITNLQEFDRICKVLATIQNDLEAKYLWEKLQKLRGKEYKGFYC